MMWGLHKLTDGEGENKNGYEKKHQRQSLREKRCHTVKRQQTIADRRSVDFLSSSFLRSFLCLSSSRKRPIPSFNPGSQAEVVKHSRSARFTLTEEMGLFTFNLHLQTIHRPNKNHSITNEIHGHLFFPSHTKGFQIHPLSHVIFEKNIQFSLLPGNSPEGATLTLSLLSRWYSLMGSSVQWRH